MPELPEVETIRRGLEKYLVGRKIENVEVRLARIFQGDIKDITGAKFKDIKRFGKALVLDLNNGYSLAIHVKMTGQLVYKGKENSSEFAKQLPSKFTHVIFTLDRGAFLFYNDIRQFGWIKVLKTQEVQKQNFFKDLGPEPLVGQTSSGQSNLTLDKFKEIISNKSTNIKVLLMDQKKIAGVGNIYANDALFLAGIDPRRPAKSLAEDEIVKLYKAIIEVLKRGLKYGGSSENTYVNALGETGSYQEYALVYGKTGKPCPKCGTPIEFVRLGGRGTFFCSSCQH